MNPHRRHPFILTSAILVYIFLYAPIIVLILFALQRNAGLNNSMGLATRRDALHLAYPL